MSVCVCVCVQQEERSRDVLLRRTMAGSFIVHHWHFVFNCLWCAYYIICSVRALTHLVYVLQSVLCNYMQMKLYIYIYIYIYLDNRMHAMMSKKTFREHLVAVRPFSPTMLYIIGLTYLLTDLHSGRLFAKQPGSNS